MTEMELRARFESARSRAASTFEEAARLRHAWHSMRRWRNVRAARALRRQMWDAEDAYRIAERQASAAHQELHLAFRQRQATADVT